MHAMTERGGWIAILVAGVGVVVGGGCGGSGGETSPDGTVADTTAPKVVSVSPTGNVSVLAKLTVTFDEPLDASTVTAANVRLTARLDDSFPQVPGTVTSDASSITFTPMRPLNFDGIYELQVGAVADTSGNAFAGDTIPIHTVVNVITHETQYNAANQVSGSVEIGIDATGHMTTMIAKDVNGVATSHEEYEFRADGAWFKYRRYDIGTDNKWNTPDDPVILRDEYTYDAADKLKLTTFAEFAGEQTMRIDYSWNARSLATSKVFDSPGDDLAWNSPDDRGPQWRDNTQDTTGAIIRQTFHNSGADGLPMVGNDDFIMSSTVFERDPTTFAVTKQTMYGGPGGDMMWLTNDDAVANYSTFTTDSRGLVLTRTLYSNANAITGRQVITYDANGLETNRDSFNGNGELFNYTTTEYDSTGMRTKQVLYTGAGNDGDWHTPDDIKAVERAFDMTH
jgi:hypothetical protein